MQHKAQIQILFIFFFLFYLLQLATISRSRICNIYMQVFCFFRARLYQTEKGRAVENKSKEKICWLGKVLKNYFLTRSQAHVCVCAKIKPKIIRACLMNSFCTMGQSKMQRTEGKFCEKKIENRTHTDCSNKHCVTNQVWFKCEL